MNFPQLTFTRFAGAILVVMFHFANDKQVVLRLGVLSSIISIGPSFISYFFLLSGFILVVVNEKYVRLREFPHPYMFWLRRFARIYPMYFLTCVLSVLRYKQTHGILPSVKILMTNLLMCQAWIPFENFAINFPDWSLSCEAFLYLLFPFILRKLFLLSTRLIIIISLSTYVINLLIHILLVNWGISTGYINPGHWYHDFVFHIPIMHLSTFIIGISFGIILVRNIKVLVSQSIWGWLAGLGAVLWFWMVITRQPWIIYNHNGLFVPLYLMIMTGLCVSSGWLIKLLASKPMVWLGEISYGIYLLQLPLYYFVHLPGLPKLFGLYPASLYIYFPLLIITAGVFKFLVETPANRIIRSWGKKTLIFQLR